MQQRVHLSRTGGIFLQPTVFYRQPAVFYSQLDRDFPLV
jgi:hypothetical protein